MSVGNPTKASVEGFKRACQKFTSTSALMSVHKLMNQSREFITSVQDETGLHFVHYRWLNLTN